MPSPAVEKIPAKSWLILALIFSASLLNYFDRQILSILKGTLKLELGLTDSGYSYLVAAFMVPYIVMYVLGGRIVDRFGTRGPMSIFILVWSAASALAGAVQNLWQLAAARMLLGAAEPGVFPANLRAQVGWYPAGRRTFLMSLCAPATAVGAILAPPVVSLLANRRLRGRLWARLLTDPVWYFFLFWIPGYMQEKVGLSLAQLGAVGWIPSATAAVAAIVSARWSDRAATRSTDPARTRIKFVLGLSLLAPISLLIHSASTLTLLILLLCVIYTIAQLWFFYTGVVLTDIFPAKSVAGAMGVIGALGASMGALVNLGIGPFVERVGYGRLFAAVAVLYPLGALVQWFHFQLPPARSGETRRARRN